MFHLIVTASLENIVETNQVALDIRVRIRDGITHPGLRSEIHNHREMVLGEKIIDNALVGNVCFHEGPVPAQCLDFLKSAVFDIYVVIICYGVYSDDFDILKFMKQSFHQIAADKSCSTGHEDCLSVHGDIVFQHIRPLSLS